MVVLDSEKMQHLKNWNSLPNSLNRMRFAVIVQKDELEKIIDFFREQ